MVTFLAGSISWCERRQGGERKCKQILMLHLRFRLELQISGVFSSHFVSSATTVPETPGRQESQEDSWPRVLVLFIL